MPSRAASGCPASASSATTSAPDSRARSAATGSPLTTIMCSIMRAAPIAARTSRSIAATSARRRSSSSPLGQPLLRGIEALHGQDRGRPCAASCSALHHPREAGAEVQHDSRATRFRARASSIRVGPPASAIPSGGGSGSPRRRPSRRAGPRRATATPRGCRRPAHRAHEHLGRPLHDLAADQRADRDDRAPAPRRSPRECPARRGSGRC